MGALTLLGAQQKTKAPNKRKDPGCRVLGSVGAFPPVATKYERLALGLRTEDSRNFKRPFAKKRPRTDILNPGSLHLVGAFEHPWAPMDVHSAHALYNPTDNGRQKRPRNAKTDCRLF